MLTESVQDYLKTIWVLEREQGAPVSTSALADAMGFAPASATNMVKRLAELHLVEYEPYRGIHLSPAGEKMALEIVRHHRLLELYLAEALGYSWDQVHEEADRLEHHISEEFESAIAEQLGNPTHDPHGDPIPTPDLELLFSPAQPLTTLAMDDEGIIRRVRDQSVERLRYLADAGVVLGAVVRVLERETSDNELTIELEGKDVSLERGLAEKILVEPVKASDDE